MVCAIKNGADQQIGSTIYEDYMKNIYLRLGDVSVRACDENLLDFKDLSTAEIVKWQGETCYTVANWRKGKEGYDLQFVGSRPFEIPPIIFFELAKFGQDRLNEYFSDELGNHD